MARKTELIIDSNIKSVDSIQTLSILWDELQNLPDGVHKEYVWDECFDILSSLMRTLLKTVPEHDLSNNEGVELQKISRTI